MTMRPTLGWYRQLLRLLPAGFRRRQGDEMLELLSDYLRGRPRHRKLLIALRAAIDVLGLAVLHRSAPLHREPRGRSSLRALPQELWFSARALAQRPGFSLVAIATLALGIGGNTAVFSLVNGVLLQPLPYADSERIGILWHEFGNGAQNMPAVNPLDVRDYRDRTTLFEDFTIATGRERILGDSRDPELVDIGFVEAGFFEFFGVTPDSGRAFSRQDDLPGAAPVAILSHRLWVRRFGSDPRTVGEAIDLDGARVQVVGVLPASFRLLLPAEAFLLRDAEVWVPMRLDPATVPTRNVTLYTGFGKIRSDATFAQAQAEIEALAELQKVEHPELALANLRARIVPLHQDVVKASEAQLVLLLAAVGFVLVIACANVANLVVLRGQGRALEYSLRGAIGARRTDLVRLAMLETLLLSLAGALLGALLALVGIDVLKALAPASVPRLSGVVIDARVLLFAATMTLASAAVFGLVPALRTTTRDPADVLGGHGRSSARRGRVRARSALVVVEVAASLILLVGTGLMVRSFAALQAVHPGFATDDALTFRVSLPTAAFPDPAARRVFVELLSERLSGLPNVDGVAAANLLPLSGGQSQQPIAYDEETATYWESVTADTRSVTPGFFAVVGATIIAGREFTTDDLAAENRVVVDERLAARAFPNGDAVGGRIQVAANDTPEAERYAQVVGVVAHLRNRDLSRERALQIYWPFTGSSRFGIWVRTGGDPGALTQEVRRQMAELAPGAPVEDIRTVAELVAHALAPARLTLALMSVFGLVALLLATVGTYGVLSYAITERTREFGIRLALGQAPASILRAVMAEGAMLVGIAVALGLGGAVLLSRLAAGLLYATAPFDPLSYAVTTLVLVAAAGTACWLPARRATRANPLAALRAE